MNGLIIPFVKNRLQGEPAVYKSGKYRGQPMHYDREEEYVKGLRNILKDLASNVLIRRVLFGTSDFDFDVHLEQGAFYLLIQRKGVSRPFKRIRKIYIVKYAECSIP